MSTSTLTTNLGPAPRVIKVMSFDVSLANKLAAWFERRLVRDLYDIYFIITAAGLDLIIRKTVLDLVRQNKKFNPA